MVAHARIGAIMSDWDLIGEVQHPLPTGAAGRLATAHPDPPCAEKLVHFLLRCDKIVNILHNGEQDVELAGAKALPPSPARH